MKKVLSLALTALLLTGLCLPARAVDMKIPAKSAVLMEAKTGTVLYQKQEYQLIQQKYQQI